MRPFTPARSIMLQSFIVVAICFQTAPLAEVASFNLPPRIVGQPMARSVSVGDTIGFSVKAVGIALRYQWYKDLALIPSATQATYTIRGATVEHAGSYFCRISSSQSVNSDTVALEVRPWAGRRPTAIPGLHIWVRSDFGFKYWRNARQSVSTTSCASTATGNHATSCYCRSDMNTAPQTFTIYVIFRGHADSCEVFKNSLFTLYCRPAGIFLRYENGTNVALPLVADSLSLLRITRLAQTLIVYANGRKVDSIAAENVLDYLPSLAIPNYIDACFSIGSAALAPWLWTGTVKEMLLYNRALTDSENNDVVGYLRGYHLAGLYDIVHTEIAYAPPFDPSVMEYVAAVPDATYSLRVGVLPASGATVEGQPSPQDVFLTANPRRVGIRAQSPIGPADYGLTVTRTPDYAIYVNDDATGANNGSSWHDAYTELQKALDAAGASGKEIWVAEGIYKPSRRTNPNDPRTVTFLITPGTDLCGGFSGVESERNGRQGSAHQTILSGDLDGDDAGAGPMWPPASQYLDDNAYHVVTISGPRGAASIMIEGFTITGGNADGLGQNISSKGGGVVNNGPSAIMEFCAIERNIARSAAGGMLNAGDMSISHCGFFCNRTVSGSGGGLFNDRCRPKIDGCVFDGNSANEGDGGGMYNRQSDPIITNSVVVSNVAARRAGGICNDRSSPQVINCTFFGNNAQIEGGAIYNDSASHITVVNAILWNDLAAGSDPEISGPSDVMYSCVKDENPDDAIVWPGEGNIDDNPRFVLPSSPPGENGDYGDPDDGLAVSSLSPCINKGTGNNAPLFDILDITRADWGAPDMGAYEFAPQEGTIGILSSDGMFQPRPVRIIPNASSLLDIRQASKTRYFARVIRGACAQREYMKPTVYGELKRKGGSGGVKVYFHEVARQNGQIIYQSQTPSGQGKPILFVNNPALQGNVQDAYVLWCLPGDELEVVIPHSQF